MIGLLIAALCIVLNGFFVAAEFALVKVRATRLTVRARRGERRAIAAKRVIERLDRYLSVSQVGITLASLGLGWVGEPAISRLVEDYWIRIVGHEPGHAVRVAVDVVALSLLTFVHVLLGEQVPKLAAIQRSEGTVLFSAMPLRIVYYAFRPILFVLERSTDLILRLMGLSAEAVSEKGLGAMEEEEIIGILAASAGRTPKGKAKSELFERVMRFAERAARHSMVPRVDVVSLPLDATGAQAYELIRTHQYSRILLTKERSLDDVAGYLYAKDFLLDPNAKDLPDMRSLRRDVLFVPESRSGVDVLRDMQRKHIPIAVVVDEYGGTSGIVTMEDLLEEIVGEIRDEFDVEPQKVVKVAGESATWDVDGRTALEELRAIGVEASPEELGESVGALVVGQLGRLPRVGDTVALAPGATAEVTGISRRRVTRVRVRVTREATREEEEALERPSEMPE